MRMIWSNTADGEDEKKQWGNYLRFGNLSRHLRQSECSVSSVLVLPDTRRDNCVKYHIQTSTNYFFISFDKPVSRSPVYPVAIDKLDRERKSILRLDPSLLSSPLLSLPSLWPDTDSNFTGIKALNILSCVTVKNCLENISLEFRNLQRQFSSLLSCFFPISSSSVVTVYQRTSTKREVCKKRKHWDKTNEIWSQWMNWLFYFQICKNWHLPR